MKKRLGLMTAVLIVSIGVVEAMGTQETRVIDLPVSGEWLRPDPSTEATFTPSGDRGFDLLWTQSLGAPGAGYPYTPTLFDVDGDGILEVFLTGGHTFGLNGADGGFLPGWPTVEQSYMGYGTNGNMPGPSVADFVPGGTAEVLWTLRDWYAGSSHIWTFNGKSATGANLPGFPADAPDESSNALDSPFVLGDTDENGNLEAWGFHTLGNSGDYYRVTAYNHLGTHLFTRDLPQDESIINLYFGDLDGNGADEMFVLTLEASSIKLRAFESDGSDATGYPVVLQTLSGGYLPFGPPIPADLDDDGDLEILMGHWGSGPSRAYCSHHDGSPVAGFPMTLASNSQLFYIGLGDITGDGDPELLAFDNDYGAAYRAIAIDMDSGGSLSGWPVALANWPQGFPTVVDISGDARQEFCFVTNGGELFALDGDGLALPGFPKTMAGPSISGVAAGDIDGDGLFELVAATWDGWVQAWDTDGPALASRADWPLRGVDARNTGIYRGAGDLTAVAEPPGPGIGLRLSSNPVGSRAEFLIDAADPDAVLTIFDSRGRLVERIKVGGRERLGWTPTAMLPAGVYLARLGSKGEAKPLKFVLLH